MGNFISGIALSRHLEQQGRNGNAISTLTDSLIIATLEYKKNDLGQSRSTNVKTAEHAERVKLLEAAKELVAALENPEIAILEVAK